jgi:hypothetical protein
LDGDGGCGSGMNAGLVSGGEKAAEVFDGVFGSGHLAEMVLPDIGLDGAAGERLASDLDDFSATVNAGVGDGGDHEAHVSAGLPEAAREFVREEKGIVTALGGEQGDSGVGARPGGLDVGLEPATKFESVKLSLVKQQMQNVFAVHGLILKGLMRNERLKHTERRGTETRKHGSDFCCVLTSRRRRFLFWGGGNVGLEVGSVDAKELVGDDERFFGGRRGVGKRGNRGQCFCQKSPRG